MPIILAHSDPSSHEVYTMSNDVFELVLTVLRLRQNTYAEFNDDAFIFRIHRTSIPDAILNRNYFAVDNDGYVSVTIPIMFVESFLNTLTYLLGVPPRTPRPLDDLPSITISEADQGLIMNTIREIYDRAAQIVNALHRVNVPEENQPEVDLDVNVSSGIPSFAPSPMTTIDEIMFNSPVGVSSPGLYRQWLEERHNQHPVIERSFRGTTATANYQWDVWDVAKSAFTSQDFYAYNGGLGKKKESVPDISEKLKYYIWRNICKTLPGYPFKHNATLNQMIEYFAPMGVSREKFEDYMNELVQQGKLTYTISREYRIPTSIVAEETNQPKYQY